VITVPLVPPTVGRPSAVQHRMVDRPSSVDGLVVGFREFWPNFGLFTQAFEDLLRTRADVRGAERVDGTHPRSGPVLARWEEFTRTVDWAISGLGGCGGCAPWAVEDAVELESRGVPTVTLVTPDLVGVARRTAERLGWPGIRIVTLSPFLDDLTPTEVRLLADEKFDEVLSALKTP
jgi:hypothetical protein